MKGLFAVVAGPRLGGKTTLAGTCPGSTLLLQAGLLETGSRSAAAKAKKAGNKLGIKTFHNLADLKAVLDKITAGAEVELDDKEKFDTKTCTNVYVDGLSAITDLRFDQPDIQALVKKNVWDGYLKLGQDVSAVVLALKGLTLHGKNVWLTCALKIKQEGNTTDVELETKGKMAVTSITKLGEAVLTVMEVPTQEGQTRRVLLTKSYDKWPGRIDGILDEDNPGFLDCDLTKVLDLISSAS